MRIPPGYSALTFSVCSFGGGRVSSKDTGTSTSDSCRQHSAKGLIVPSQDSGPLSALLAFLKAAND